jgi:hypothetical protein
MRQLLSMVLALGILTAAPDVTTQITAMPLGTNIEIRLKSKQRMRGARGAVLNSGFALVDAHAKEQQIAFDDVASVKLFTQKSHTTRNILIGVGITLVVLGIIGSRI